MNQKSSKINSMYVHIPFCKSICSYCDFPKVIYNEKYVIKYIDVLIKSIKEENPNKCKTIYIGGGTPSCLELKEIEKLLSFLSGYLLKDGEFTIEVNPETIDDSKMKLFAKYGINRLSIGVQTFNKNLLKLLNRVHSYDDVKNCVMLANKYKIKNYSFDFIFAIKGQSKRILKYDLKKALALKPKHLSFYSLILEKNTVLYINKYKEVEEDKVRDMYDFIYDYLKKHNFNRYEVSNFSKVDYESLHNLTYWNNEEYYAFGLGASSYINRVRKTNSRDLLSYLKSDFKYESEIISDKDYEFEYIMLKLRLVKGINLKEYKLVFKQDFLLKYKKEVEKLIKLKLLIINKEFISTTYEGMMLLDYVFGELTKEM